MGSSGSPAGCRRQQGAFQPLHKSLAQYVPMFYAAQTSLVLVLSQLPLFGMRSSGLEEAGGVLAAVTCYALPAMSAPTFVRVVCQVSKERFTRALITILLHLIVLSCAYWSWLRISFPFLRFGIATLNIIFQIKLHEIILYAMHYYGGADPEVHREQIVRGQHICTATPLERAGFVLVGLNYMDVDLVPIHSRFSLVVKPAIIQLLKAGVQFASCGVMLGVLYFELGIVPPRALLILCHMSCVYPTLSVVVVLVQVPMLYLSDGRNPRFREGENPFASGSIRQFWGRRYNLIISDLCNRTIFSPLQQDCRWSAASASLAVFLFTGFLHAVPVGVLSTSTPSQFFLQLLFFLSHWAACVWESTSRPPPSVLRTWLLFLVLYPSFALSSIDSLTHPDIGLDYFWSPHCWDSLRHVAGLPPRAASTPADGAAA